MFHLIPSNLSLAFLSEALRKLPDLPKFFIVWNDVDAVRVAFLLELSLFRVVSKSQSLVFDLTLRYWLDGVNLVR